MKTGEIVTDEYLQRHFDGASRVITESGYTQKRHEREIMIAQWLCDTFGGNVVLVSEDGSEYGEKRADYIWEGGDGVIESFDIIGTVAFAISGAVVGIRKRMDIFGVIMLAVTTACGGGLIRDLMIGNTPPMMFLHPLYAGASAVVALLTFLYVYRRAKLPDVAEPWYEGLLFWFDTIGLAAFTVDGVMVGVRAGYGENEFLLVFLGFMTGAGGGALRDVLADRTPDIFMQHIYAVAAIVGGLTMVLCARFVGFGRTAMWCGFGVVIALRVLSMHFKWNLPRI